MALKLFLQKLPSKLIENLMASKKLLRKLPEITIDNSGESTRLVRSGLFFGVLLFVIFLIWSALAPIHGAVVTSGIIKIDLNRKTLQHLEGGIIKEILIREGSRVEKGQTLLVLEDILTSSQFYILKDRNATSLAKEARLQAQRKNASTIIFPEELTDRHDRKITKIISAETELFNSKAKSIKDQVELLTFEITQTELELEGLEKQMEAIKAGIGYIKKQVQASRALKKKGYVEDSKIWEQLRLLSEKREKIGSLLAEKAIAQAKITNTRLRIITLENTYIQEADDELKETQKELREIQELLRPAKYAFERSAVIAPLAGQVINLKVNTVGGVVQPGAELMELVPYKKELIIEAKIETSDIDSVHLDQRTNIQLLAYSSRRTPMLTGKIIYISEDVIEDTADPGVYYYLSHIKVDASSLAGLSDDILLFPGMPITAFIQTRPRTFIDFVLEPIITHARRSLREE